MNGTMTALVWRGAGELRLENAPSPTFRTRATPLCG